MKKLLFLCFCSLFLMQCVSQKPQAVNDYETGALEDGYKVGVWEYKGRDGETELTIDYDNGSLLYLKPDTSEYLVKVNGEWSLQRLSRHPRYMGSYAEFYKILGANIRYPLNASNNGIERTVFLEFEVSPEGRAINLQVINDKHWYFTDEITNAFKKIPDLWIDAIYEGQSVPAKIILPFYFKIDGSKSGIEYDKAMLEELEGKKFAEVVVTAYKTVTVREL